MKPTSILRALALWHLTQQHGASGKVLRPIDAIDEGALSRKYNVTGAAKKPHSLGELGCDVCGCDDDADGKGTFESGLREPHVA